MLNVPVLSQNNPAWKSKKLGTSNVTIGDFGCVITCITMLAGLTDVDAVNQALIKNGGYVQQNLLYWAQVQKAVPNLKFNWRSWVYDNNQVKYWIEEKKQPVIVQVDAAPIGAPRTDHYVLFVGDKKLVDPWTGKVRPTSDFPILKGYILYEKLEAPLTDSQKLGRIKGWAYEQGKSDADVRYLIKQLLPQ